MQRTWPQLSTANERKIIRCKVNGNVMVEKEKTEEQDDKKAVVKTGRGDEKRQASGCRFLSPATYVALIFRKLYLQEISEDVDMVGLSTEDKFQVA